MRNIGSKDSLEGEFHHVLNAFHNTVILTLYGHYRKTYSSLHPGHRKAQFDSSLYLAPGTLLFFDRIYLVKSIKVLLQQLCFFFRARFFFPYNVYIR